ncbi:MAG TPA: hypothetical protein VLH35_00440, partial [Candidatus Acidoferrales bacterium]|nr:hypothetical protein [Candidatus Acidoferrales bacterium]
EITEITLKRLHTLGNQKFGSSPYSEHFNRWIATVEVVLAEFTSNPNIGIDDEFIVVCQWTLSSIKFTFEHIRRREATVNQELGSLSEHKNRLQQINTEFAKQTGILGSKRNAEIRQLNHEIDHLKKEQGKIVKMKAGFFHRVSKRERERREIDVIEELTAKQTEFELATLDLKQAQKTLREEFDKRKEPVLEDIKKVQRRIEDLETDSSLEERWFACEALVDAVNMFMLRKAAQPP